MIDSNYWQDKNSLAHCGAILGNLVFPTRFSQQLFAPIYQQTIASALGQVLDCDRFQLGTTRNKTAIAPDNAMTSGFPSTVIAQALCLGSINFCLDAACSSSLYAIHLACHYLRSHQANLMLAGAISYAEPLFNRMLFSGVQAYPDNGISTPLDKASRGLTPADGVGMLVLKRYEEAIRDGDRIYAIIGGVGLSNDGRGKFLLSPKQQGQMLAFERAYTAAGLSPQDIDYLECHATGTLLGDATELSSIDAFFGQYQAAPLVGSVKANVGHLLTAAGIVGILKVILSMARETIPPTININEPISSPNQVISPEQVVRQATSWVSKGKVKRAAVSAFGFGGTNGHLIIESPNQLDYAQKQPLNQEIKSPFPLAIVGMDAYFGDCDGLDAFERTIYEGKQHFKQLPTHRWKGIERQKDLLQSYSCDRAEAPLGAYIASLEIDTLRSKIPPNEVEQLNPQQLLMLKVADRALKDAKLSEGGNVAVIVALETDPTVHQLQQRWHLPWQLQQGLDQAQLSLSAEALAKLETTVKDSIHSCAGTSEYLSYVGNITASRISALWNFNGPAFTLSGGENSTFKALEVARMLLASGEVEAVVVGAVDLAGSPENVLLRNQLASINTGVNTLSYDQKVTGWLVGEGAGAIVLKSLDRAQPAQDNIYAAIDAVITDTYSGKQNAEAVKHTCQNAYQTAEIEPEDIGYLEVYGSGISQEDESEILGLIKAYSNSTSHRSCALGSVKANIGHTYLASGIASLIKTALCLKHRYIPAIPQWSKPKQPQMWQESPFYFPSQSMPWLSGKKTTKRIAAINGMGCDRTYAHVILSEVGSNQVSSSSYLKQMPLSLFPIGGDNPSELIEQIELLQQTLNYCDSLAEAASKTFATYQQRPQATYTLVLLGASKTELERERQRALTGVNQAFARGEEWRTPVGSYFSPKPVGKQGQIAFVYPGAFGAYVGIGQDLYRLFPSIYEDRIFKRLGVRVAEIEKFIYPKSLHKLSLRQIETLEQRFFANPLAMLQTEIAYARLTTAILKNYFYLQPHAVFGYSLGETSMMMAQEVWSNLEQGLDAFHASPLFSDRISGVKRAAQEYWGLSEQVITDKPDFWSTYVLLASPDQVKQSLKPYSRVYLTQINTPTEVVIAGDTKQCQQVIKTLDCSYFRAPFNHLIHCPPLNSEYQELVKLNSLSVQAKPKINFYSAADYQPIPLNQEVISQSIAKNLCQQFDFPQLVNRVYGDGVRIFIEVGAGSTCSRWIGEILKSKEHLVTCFNQRGMDDHTAMIRMMAKLLSHRVDVDISCLYSQVKESLQPNKSLMKRIVLGGKPIQEVIAVSKGVRVQSPLGDGETRGQGEQGSLEDGETRGQGRQGEAEIGEINQKTVKQEYITSHQATPDYAIALPQNYLNYLNYQKLSEHNASLLENQINFLQARQESLQQISQLIKQQIDISEKLLAQASTKENTPQSKLKNLEENYDCY